MVEDRYPAVARLIRRPGFVIIAGVSLMLFYVAWAFYVTWSDKLIDFYVYYIAAAGFQQGLDVYALTNSGWEQLAKTLNVPCYAFPYRYPPLLAVMVMPLLSLPPRLAGFVWTLISATMAMSAGALLALAWPGDTKRLTVAWVLMGLFVPILTTLYAGQANILVLFAVAFAIWFFTKERPVEAGLFLALGIMWKPMPALLLAYFLWRREWRVVAGALVGLICLSLACMPFAGRESLVSYAMHMFSLADAGAVTANSPPNQSLIALFSRLLTCLPWGEESVDIVALAWMLGRGLGLGMVVASFLICRPRRPSQLRFLEEVSLIIVITHLLASMTWYHHLAILFVPLFTILSIGLDCRRRRWWLWVAMISLVLIDVQGLLWHSLTSQPLLLSLGTYAMVIMWVLLAWGLLGNSHVTSADLHEDI